MTCCFSPSHPSAYQWSPSGLETAGEKVISLILKDKIFDIKEFRVVSLSSADLSVLLLFEDLDLFAEHLSLGVAFSLG